jgi:hypothetical protein
MGVGVDGVFLGHSPADAGCRAAAPAVPRLAPGAILFRPLTRAIPVLVLC